MYIYRYNISIWRRTYTGIDKIVLRHNYVNYYQTHGDYPSIQKAASTAHSGRDELVRVTTKRVAQYETLTFIFFKKAMTALLSFTILSLITYRWSGGNTGPGSIPADAASDNAML